MLYTVKVIPKKEPVTFRFNTFAEMENFVRDVMAAVDGFEDGKTLVMASKEEENPTNGNS
jgi:hypothetical protein